MVSIGLGIAAHGFSHGRVVSNFPYGLFFCVAAIADAVIVIGAAAVL